MTTDTQDVMMAAIDVDGRPVTEVVDEWLDANKFGVKALGRHDPLGDLIPRHILRHTA